MTVSITVCKNCNRRKIDHIERYSHERLQKAFFCYPSSHTTFEPKRITRRVKGERS